MQTAIVGHVALAATTYHLEAFRNGFIQPFGMPDQGILLLRTCIPPAIAILTFRAPQEKPHIFQCFSLAGLGPTAGRLRIAAHNVIECPCYFGYSSAVSGYLVAGRM